ncbi:MULTISPECIES: hypothetical protein [Natrinema]|uniref:Small CPxCG-related zinc finger protein n=1 Tax=Natrinema gari JCM 14663 TaxID=1230459 RepID=L9ZC19_9EURY|nr:MULTISPECIES: hypothetical protein [Natrinema]AFO56631.1 hypothetical protein NJ7G_1384 [Natrinema sp. J7-2]ELY82708.1 hypothetical protein C486_04128 [Natrinema gari JCM 14663]
MSLSTLLDHLFSGTGSATDAPETPRENGDDAPSVTVVHECRDCGTNVSDGTTCCPACEGEDIVTYSIE